MELTEKRFIKFLERVPMATHNQRGRGIISIKVAHDFDVSLESIIKIIERSMSSSVYEVLKRVGRKSRCGNCAYEPEIRGRLRKNYGRQYSKRVSEPS